ncbi:MAG: ATP-binding protein [Gemmatimonadaceae bacterium]
MTKTPSGTYRAVRAMRAVPLERKLPLLISGLLILMLVIATAAAYREVRTTTSDAATARLKSVARQLVDLTRQSGNTRAAFVRRTLADSSLRSLLAGPSVHAAPESSGIAIVTPRARRRAPSADSTVQALLQKLAVPTESLLVARVWDAKGRVRATAGPPSSDVDVAQAAELLARVGRADTIVSSQLYLANDSVLYWTIAPVIDRGAVIGHVGQRRRIARNPVAEQQLRDLLGEDLQIHFTNVRGDVESSLGGASSTPTAIPRTPKTVFSYDRPGEGERLASAAPLVGLPWIVLVDMPRAAITARPRAFLRRMAIVTAALVFAGALLAWAMSRRLTHPLAELTTATTAVARGDYDYRVNVSTRDELGRLGDAFNVMAERVAVARSELESTAAALGDTNEALRRSNAELAEQTQVAEAARRDAVAASQAKSDFLAVMSHELRTPLNAILGFSSLMLDEIPGPVSEAQRAQLGRINAGGRHLLSLIDEVLTLARVEAGRESVRTEEGDIYAIARETASLAEPMAGAKRLSLRTVVPDGQCIVHTDLTKVRQILLNLLTNAVKFTSQGEVMLSARCDNGEVTFDVRDSGIGIEPHLLPKIFEPFYQIDQSKTRRAAGTGLGLSVTRHLARLLGGDVSVVSVPGEGSTFTVVVLTHAPANENGSRIADRRAPDGIAAPAPHR